MIVVTIKTRSLWLSRRVDACPSRLFELRVFDFHWQLARAHRLIPARSGPDTTENKRKDRRIAARRPKSFSSRSICTSHPSDAGLGRSDADRALQSTEAPPLATKLGVRTQRRLQMPSNSTRGVVYLKP